VLPVPPQPSGGGGGGQGLPRRFCSAAYSAAATWHATLQGSHVSVPAAAAALATALFSDAAFALLQPPDVVDCRMAAISNCCWVR
jgi:hypothetical protein